MFLGRELRLSDGISIFPHAWFMMNFHQDPWYWRVEDKEAVEVLLHKQVETEHVVLLIFLFHL